MCPFAGLLVLGYAAFYGISAYTYVILVRLLVPDPAQGYTNYFWLLIPVCVLVALIVGALLGIPVLRTRGDYLAIVTLGFGEIVRLVLNNMDQLTNGPQGLTGKAPALFTLQFKEPIHFYYLILAGCVLSIFIADRLNLPKSRVEIKSGHGGRRKVVGGAGASSSASASQKARTRCKKSERSFGFISV